MSNQKNGVIIYEMENSTGGAGAGSGVGKYQEVGSDLHVPCLLDIHISMWRD